MEMEMEIVNVELDSKLGCQIFFYSRDFIPIGAYLSTTLNERELNFEVVNLKTSEGAFIVSARSVGYRSNKIDSRTKIDIRGLLSLRVKLVTDASEIKRIDTEKTYC